VIASDVMGQRELVIPGTGFLVPKGEADAAEVQAYLQVLRPLIADLTLRQQIGSCARQHVMQHFSLAKMADQMETWFLKAICARHNTSEQSYGRAQPYQSTDMALAAEMLLIAIEYLQQEQTICDLWHDLQRLADQNHAMKTSKFWHLRRQWFKLKRWLRLTQEEEI
jgi:hypothetical protein